VDTLPFICWALYVGGSFYGATYWVFYLYHCF